MQNNEERDTHKRKRERIVLQREGKKDEKEKTLTSGQAEVAKLEHGAGAVDHHVGRLHVAVRDLGVFVEVVKAPDGVGHQSVYTRQAETGEENKTHKRGKKKRGTAERTEGVCWLAEIPRALSLKR